MPKAPDQPDTTPSIEIYLDWPHAFGYVTNTLDPKIIERHAASILARGLNVGRIVAFVGAGVSMSYGRISWRTLVETEYRLVRHKYSVFENDFKEQRRLLQEVGATAEAERAKVTYGHVELLYNALETLNPMRSDVQASKYPMVFQLLEKLDDEIRACREILPLPDRSTEQQGEPSLSTREHAVAMTLNDLGHARQILWNALIYPDYGETVADKNPKEDSIQSNINRFLPHLGKVSSERNGTNIASFYSYENINLGIKNRRFARMDLIEVIRRHSNRRAGPLNPTRRYLFGVILLRVGDSALGKLKKTTLPDEAHATPVTRRKVVKPERDPLWQLNDRLQITRFLTTNYDHEIDRLFQDRHYDGAGATSKAATIGGGRIGHEGGVLRPSFNVIVFDHEHTGDLVAFAAGGRSRAARVVHLHGRADVMGVPDIVVTEPDYQRRYLRKDETRENVDDSIQLSFGANPILFVGSNVGEDDILRPLRQFMSGSSRVGDRASTQNL